MSNCYFLTLTVHRWIPVFQDFLETKRMFLKSLEYFHKEEYVIIYAFVIMKDHIHVVVQTSPSNSIQEIIRRLKSFTGKAIITYLETSNQKYLTDNFATDRQDRHHKFWKIKSGCLLLKHPSIITQKIRYIHQNPVKGHYKAVDNDWQYKYSSAKSYLNKTSAFSFLTLYS